MPASPLHAGGTACKLAGPLPRWRPPHSGSGQPTQRVPLVGFDDARAALLHWLPLSPIKPPRRHNFFFLVQRLPVASFLHLDGAASQTKSFLSRASFSSTTWLSGPRASCRELPHCRQTVTELQREKVWTSFLFLEKRFCRTSAAFAVMDTFFISHGAPTLAIDERLAARHFLESGREKVFPTDPKAILMVSAHWDTPTLAVNVIHARNNTIYDFYGFPKAMYQIKYPAPGAPELAKKVKSLLQSAGFGNVEEDKKRGLDHGAWVPLMLMYPEANIPVCQLSIQSEKDGTYHYNIGKALAPLREEGVLIIGSGSATHNLRSLGPDNVPPPNWAAEFDRWLTKSLLDGRHEDVKQYDKKAPGAKMSHPWPEHLYPLHVALGAAGENAKAELIHQSWSNSSLSYSSYRFHTT